MAKIALLLDEDVRPMLGEILRQRGYDVIHVLGVGRAGKTDAEQLAYAVSQ
jgi:predicted nuclease of predicted toxin-antitoxin system